MVHRCRALLTVWKLCSANIPNIIQDVKAVHCSTTNHGSFKVSLPLILTSAGMNKKLTHRCTYSSHCLHTQLIWAFLSMLPESLRKQTWVALQLGYRLCHCDDPHGHDTCSYSKSSSITLLLYFFLLHWAMKAIFADYGWPVHLYKCYYTHLELKL